MSIAKVEEHAVLSGLGQSEVGRRLNRSSLQLTIDAIQAAVSDAGLEMADIDGIATFPGPIGDYVPGFAGPPVYTVQDALGIRAKWVMSSFEGPSPIAPVLNAILAVAGGQCRHAVVFRTLTESSAQGTGGRGGIAKADGQFEWLLPFGAVSGANWAALYASRYFHEFGASRSDLGWIATTTRAHASRNPRAVFRSPLTMEDYLAARPISTPLCLLDCDVPVDGSVALVVSEATSAQELRSPVTVEAMGAGVMSRPRWELWDDFTTMGAHDAAEQMWSRTDLRPQDVDVAQLYDGFSVYVLYWLEAMKLCDRGQAAEFVRGGKNISADGQLPLNTAGGQLSAGRLHGWGHLAEGMRQVRNEAGPTQIANARVSCIGVGGGIMCAALLLSARSAADR